MKKERDFLDYVSLASQLIRNAQLQGIGSQLRASNQHEAARLEIEQLEAVGRDFVFQAQEMVEGLIESHLEMNACGTLNIAMNLKEQLAACGITTKSFRSFEDKERLQSLSRDLDDLVDECESRLDQTGKEMAIASVKYQTEEPDLLLLIESITLQMDLEEKRAKLAAIPYACRMPATLAYTLLIVSCVLGIFGFLSMSNPNSSIAIESGLVLLILAGSLFLIGAIGATPVPTESALKLKKEIQPAESSEQQRQELVGNLKRKFGEKESVAAYQELLSTRRSLIQHVLEPTKSSLDPKTIEQFLPNQK